MQHCNWAGNYYYHAARLHRPDSVEQLQELVRRSGRVKALGTRHSFNGIADTTQELICLDHWDRIVALDRIGRSVTVEAGVRYGPLCRELHQEGFALHNLASLPHISVVGACATATHGSGDSNQILATAVSALEMVTADGRIVVISREEDREQFEGAVVGLGGLGIVTKLTLDLVPAFTMRQDVYENLPLSQLEERFEEIVSNAYSVSLFTDWQSARFSQVWLKRQVSDEAAVAVEPTFFTATLASRPLHPLAGLSAANCTEQGGIAGPWYERLPHFRMDYMPSSGEELQSEYFVPRRHAIAALRTMHRLGDQIAPLLQISEVRTIAADTLWMSPCYRQACVGIHFTWKKEATAVEQLLPRIEEALAPFQARPHWGKLFTMESAYLRSLYPNLPAFRQMLRSYDPEGKFQNAFLDKYVYLPSEPPRDDRPESDGR